MKSVRFFNFLNLMNKLKIMIFNFMAKRKKWGLVPPTLRYCGHNAKNAKSLLKICTLHNLIRCTSGVRGVWKPQWLRTLKVGLHQRLGLLLYLWKIMPLRAAAMGCATFYCCGRFCRCRGLVRESEQTESTHPNLSCPIPLFPVVRPSGD